MTPEQAGELRDRDGVPLLDAMSDAGLEPELGRSDWLDQVELFVELHVELVAGAAAWLAAWWLLREPAAGGR